MPEWGRNKDMAKRRTTRGRGRKTTARRGRPPKVEAPAHELPGGFWRQVGAVLMIAVAVILVFTWFGSGGGVLNMIHEKATWLIGYAAYLIPILLVYIAVMIFRSEDNRVSGAMWFAAILMVVWVAGIAGIPTIGQENPTGGIVGEGLNRVVTQILNAGVAVFVYIVLIFITAIFMFFHFCFLLLKKIIKKGASKGSRYNLTAILQLFIS